MPVRAGGSSCWRWWSRSPSAWPSALTLGAPRLAEQHRVDRRGGGPPAGRRRRQPRRRSTSPAAWTHHHGLRRPGLGTPAVVGDPADDPGTGQAREAVASARTWYSPAAATAPSAPSPRRWPAPGWRWASCRGHRQPARQHPRAPAGHGVRHPGRADRRRPRHRRRAPQLDRADPADDLSEDPADPGDRPTNGCSSSWRAPGSTRRSWRTPRRSSRAGSAAGLHDVRPPGDARAAGARLLAFDGGRRCDAAPAPCSSATPAPCSAGSR